MSDDQKKVQVEEDKAEAAQTAQTAASDVSNSAEETTVESVEPATKEQEVEAIEAPQDLIEIEAKEKDGEVAPAKEVVLQEAELEEIKDEPVKAHSPSDDGKWYIIHTYSGHENKVAKSLHQRMESMGFENRIFEIIVPTRDTVKVSQGKKENVKEKIFPGYVLVKMILDDESWLLVRTTQGVTAFIGAGNKPTPISDKEVQAIQKFMATEEPLYKTAFTIGEAVKIVDGPFADFLGTIDNIDEAKGKLKVLVSIFGRETPVELDFLQVSKL